MFNVVLSAPRPRFGASPGLQVLLLADRVGLAEPGAKLRIQVRGRLEAKRVQMIPRRERLHATEAPMFEPAREHDVAVDPALSRRHLRERHPHLKGDPRLLRHDPDGPNGLDDGDKAIEQRADFRRLAGEVMLEVVRGTRMRLIAVGELPSAIAAAPERLVVSHVSLRTSCQSFDLRNWRKGGYARIGSNARSRWILPLTQYCPSWNARFSAASAASSS